MPTPEATRAEVRVLLQWPDKVLSQNARVHWSKRARATKAARQHTGWATIRAMGTSRKPGWQRAKVALTFCPPDRRRRDLQNCIGAAKALIDACPMPSASMIACSTALTNLALQLRAGPSSFQFGVSKWVR